MPQPQLKPIEERDPYAAKVMEAFDKQAPMCCPCEFDEVSILQRIREYVAGVNDDYKEDEERDQTLAMIDALIHQPLRQLKPIEKRGACDALMLDAFRRMNESCKYHPKRRCEKCGRLMHRDTSPSVHSCTMKSGCHA